MKKDNFESYVVVGRVRKAFGIKGQLSIDWFDGACPVDIKKENIYFKRENGLVGFSVTKDHIHGNYNVLNIKDVSSRAEAEQFRGLDIFVEALKLPALNDDEYYTYELLEMRVETLDGRYLGRIDNIFSTGSNDVYVVKNGEKELLLPATHEVIKEVDKQKGLMKVDMIEGLE